MAQNTRPSIEDAKNAVRTILQFLGEDADREGLQETPNRVIRSWERLYGGYIQTPAEILKTQFSEIEQYDQMVTLRDIEFYSMCEHHMLPFFGKVHIAYIPRESVVGISKLARLVEVFARRLQIQERLTQQISDAINSCLSPQGVGVVIEAQHFCMVARGVEKQNSKMVTSALKGIFLENPIKSEFLTLCKI
jgi:GTP cyclohydrolase IA